MLGEPTPSSLKVRAACMLNLPSPGLERAPPETTAVRQDWGQPQQASCILKGLRASPLKLSGARTVEGLGEDPARDGLGVAKPWFVGFPSWCDESPAHVYWSLTIRPAHHSPSFLPPQCATEHPRRAARVPAAVLSLHGPHCSTGQGRGGVWRVPPAVTLSEQSRGCRWSPRRHPVNPDLSQRT